MKRRDFFHAGAVAGAGALLLPAACVSPQQDLSGPGAGNDASERWRRDLAVVNGRVVTLEDDQPAAEAVLIRQGRIALVGTTDQVTREAGSAPRFDAAGRTVVPGFVDPHVHFEMACNALSYQVACHTPPFTSLREIKDALRAKAATTTPGEWIIGRGGFGMAGLVEEGHLPERAELDAVTEDHPLILYAGFHVAMINTRGLRELGLWDDDSNVPRGAILHRGDSGLPTGIATEVWPMPPAYSVDQVEASLRAHAHDLYVSKGMTSISTLPLAGTDLIADQAVQASGDLPIRLRAYYHVPHLLTLEDFLGMGLAQGFGTDMFRVGGVKIFVDGAGSNGLGRRFTDFKWTQEELNAFVLQAHSHGVQLMMHAVTDPGHQMVEAAVEATLAREPASMRPRVEHGGDVESIERVRRLARLGIIPVITPQQERAATPRTGSRTTPRYRTLVEAGVMPAACSDATGTVPVFSPLGAIASLVASPEEGGGTPPGEELTFDDALRMHTIWAARSGFEDHDRGSVAVGKFGDLAVLSADHEGMTGGELYDLRVDATILGGDVVFER
jgi:predicted amidohydrolase YtcJ